MEKLAKFIIKSRYWIIALTLVITLVLGSFIKNLQINPDILSYLPKDDSVSVLFDQIGEKYGGNQTAVIGFKTDDIFTTNAFKTIEQITDSAEAFDGVSTVISLTNVIDIKEVDSVLEIGKLINEEQFPLSDNELKDLKKYVLSKDMYKGTLVSEDATMTMIAIKFSEGVDKTKSAVLLQKKINKIHTSGKLYYGGLPYMLKNVGDIILNDIIFLGPLAFLVIAITLFFGFKSFSGVVLPLLSVGIAIIWTLGLMALFKYEITLVSNVSPIILLAVGSAYTIHVLNRINETTESDYHKKVQVALSYIIVPVFFASLTTMVGFVSFVFGSYLTMISSFGLFTALGVLFSLLLSVSFVPALLTSFKNKEKANFVKVKPNRKESKMILAFLKRINNLVFNHPKYIISVWAIIVIVFILGTFKIQRKVDMLDYFKKDDSGRLAEEMLREKFGGTLPVYITIKGNIQSPEVLKMMRKTEDYLESLPEISHAQSVADLIEEMNNIMGEGKIIPNDEGKIFNLWFLLEGQDIMEQLVSSDLDEGLIQGTLNTSDSKLMNRVVDKIQLFINNNKSNDFEIEQTGFPSIYKKLDKSLIKSQFQSLIIAIMLVFLAVAGLLKSVTKGFFASIPIIVTLIVLFGFMGFTGIPLDVATVLVGSISIGIGVDYAIHMITHYNYEFKKYGKIKEALEQSIKISGKSITINVVSVTFGFIVLLFSRLVPLQRFGALVGVTMITSGLATLTLLPAIIILSNRYLPKLFTINSLNTFVKKGINTTKEKLH
ncbi:MAG: RND family transporter [Chlorobi bacterium]|nr:RND family transporter [Chlorobiota bacterium]